MRHNLNARTEWEIDAARRRELVESDLAARRLLRLSAEQRETAPADERRGLFSTLAGAISGAPAKPADEPCPPAGALNAVEPGA